MTSATVRREEEKDRAGLLGDRYKIEAGRRFDVLVCVMITVLIKPCLPGIYICYDSTGEKTPL